MRCKAVVFIYFPISVFAAILNAVGIYLLVKDRSTKTNQNLILKCLSAFELTDSCVLIILWSLTCYGSNTSGAVILNLSRVLYCTYGNYWLIMIFMTFDRLITVKYPLRHSFILTKKRARTVLFLSTLFCIIVVIACNLAFGFDQFMLTFNTVVAPVVSSLSAIFIVTTYIYIFVKISKRRMDMSLQNVQVRRATENQQFLKMAMIITFTYFMFCLMPDIAYIFARQFIIDSIDIVRIFWYSGLIFDPITYIFMQRRLRQKLLEKLLRFRKKHQRDSSGGEQSIARITEDEPAVLDTKL